MVSSWQCPMLRLLTIPLLMTMQLPRGVSQVHFNSQYTGSRVTRLVGSAAQFSWSFYGDADIIKWGTKDTTSDAIKDVLVTLSTSGSLPITPPVQYAGRVSGYWNGNKRPGHVVFKLTSIKNADEKFYVCQINPSSNRSFSIRDTLHLVVRDPPVISPISIAASYKEGSQVSISCLATGTPNPDVTWIRNGQVKSTGKNSALLTFNSINRADDGQYTCKATNTDGCKEEQITLVVHYSPVISPVSVAASYNEGSQVSISCRATGTPNPDVTWLKNRQVKSTGKNSAVLTFSSINRADDGQYTCKAKNLAGGKEKQIILVVHYPPVIRPMSVPASYSEGLQVSITCQARGKPDPDVTWIRNGQVKSTGKNSAVLAFNSINRADDGQYTCKATNSDGCKEEQVTLVVHYKPGGTTLTTSVRGDAAVQGDSVTFTCRVTAANPAVSVYRIYLNDSNTPVAEPTDGQYTINNVQRSQHHGRYKCIPRNDVGDGLPVIVDLKIKVPSQLVHVPQNQTVNEKDPVLIRCKASGYPAPTITWTKDGNLLTASDETVDITQSKRTDTGRYVCKADNGVEQPQTAAAYITVQYPASVIDYSPIASKLWIGQTVKLKCVSDGVPTPNVTWFKPNGNELHRVIAKENIVDVMMAVDEDFGDYKCIAVNGVSSADTVTVNVQRISSPFEERITVLHSVYLAVIAFLLLAIVVLCVILWKIYRSSEFKRANRKTSGEVIIMNSLAAEDSIQASSRARPDNITYGISASSDYMPLDPSTRSWEVKRNQVNIIKLLQKGAFSQVAMATARGIKESKGEITVAVKMLKANATKSDRNDLLSELELMKKLKPHPHVIELIGCVTESDPLLVVIEYMPYGDLLGYLRKSRGLNDTYFKDPDVKPQSRLTAEHLLRFAWQIADGMCYLSSIKIIHRNLAARNVLVGEGQKCKVTDFGMSKNVEQDDIYIRENTGRLPAKWTAYEALFRGTYTTQSDVWSYGVVLYEILTVGGTPYPHIDARQIAKKLQEGYRMPKPQHVDSRLYQVMLQCWQVIPRDRPTFAKLKDTMKEMEKNHRTYVNLKQYDGRLYANV